MEKYRYLAKNIGLLSLSNMGTKLLAFFFVPLYTNILTTTEYGIFDLFNTTIGIMIPILTLNIMEAVLRFSIDQKMDRSAICSIAMGYIWKSTLVVAAFMLVNHYFLIFIEIDEYFYIFFIMYLLQAMSGVVTSFARGGDYMADIAIASILSAMTTFVCNVLFLVYFKWGLFGYCMANILAMAVQNIYLIVKVKFWRYVSFQKYTIEKKEMLDYCKPMIANSIAWWVNNASDRYVVILLCGMSANGIYSVASKIPSILSIFQTIFNQAWTLSAVKDFDAEDNSGFFNTLYNSYNCIMTICCAGIIFVNRLLARFLYAKDFYEAWKCVPFLLISILFGALSGYVGGIFSAVKDSKIFAKSTVYGAVTNIILNFTLIPFTGIIGAAIATAISYWLVWVVRVIHVKKYMDLKINYFRDYVAYGCLIIQSIAFLLFEQESVILYLGQGVIIFVIVLLFFNEIKLVMKKILGVLR